MKYLLFVFIASLFIPGLSHAAHTNPTTWPEFKTIIRRAPDSEMDAYSADQRAQALADSIPQSLTFNVNRTALTDMISGMHGTTAGIVRAHVIEQLYAKSHARSKGTAYAAIATGASASIITHRYGETSPGASLLAGLATTVVSYLAVNYYAQQLSLPELMNTHVACAACNMSILSSAIIEHAYHDGIRKELIPKNPSDFLVVAYLLFNRTAVPIDVLQGLKIQDRQAETNTLCSFHNALPARATLLMKAEQVPSLKKSMQVAMTMHIDQQQKMAAMGDMSAQKEVDFCKTMVANSRL